MKRIGSRSKTRKRLKYWWTDEIGELWKESCLARRRFVGRIRHLIKRGGRYEDIVNDDELLKVFKGGVEGFAGSGPTSNTEFQGGVLEGTPERSGFDSWGLPFRLVTNKLRGSSGPLTASMTEEFLAEVIAELFPRVEPFAFPPADFPRDEIRDVAVTEREIRLLLDAASKRRSDPGPNGVHYHILGKSAGVLCARLSGLYTACFREATFPTPWKEANLVLFEKPGRNPTTPSAYRPICLLDVEGKLFERVIASRVDEHIRSGGGRNDLSLKQYGFRAGRPTTDALDHMSAGIPWFAIWDGLTSKSVHHYLTSIFASIFSERKIAYEKPDGTTRVDVFCGVSSFSAKPATSRNFVKHR